MNDREISSWRKWAILTVSVAWFSCQMWWAARGFPGVILVRPVHLIFAMVLVYLVYPLKLSRGGKVSSIVELILNLIPLALLGISAVYYIVNYERLLTRWATYHPLSALDKIVGISIMVLLLEAGRRVIGVFLSIFASIFLLYGILGPYLPGPLSHHGLSFLHMLDLQTLTDFGIFGVALGVSVTFVYYFIILSSYLNAMGGDRLLTDVALASAGRTWGGAAKAAVVGSSLVGTISGSAAANVVTTGTLTIPLMKKAGFRSEFAAAVESAASTGGQIMPPIMGSSAFLMAYLLGKPYWQIAKAAAIPAILYYASLFGIIHVCSVKYGIRPLRAEELPDAKKTIFRYWHVAIPVILLVIQIVRLVTLTMAAFRALLVLFAVSFVQKHTRFTAVRFLQATEKGATSAAMVTVACALAGIVIGVVDYTGLGIKVTASLAEISAASKIAGLSVIIVSVLILGMGMPTVGAYLSGSILMAPAMIRMGYAPIVSHLFILYYAVISMVTPPIAISAYVAAGIAGAKIGKTGWIAFLLCSPGFLIPLLCLKFPSLIQHNSLSEMIMVLLPFFAFLVGVIYLAPILFRSRQKLSLDR